MEQRLSLVTLGVDDLKRSIGFYEKLGWKRANQNEEVAFFQLGGIILALWSWKSLAEDAKIPAEGSGFRRCALAYNARSRADADTVLAEAKAAGAKILKPAKETPWGGYSGYFADPDDHIWEVAHNPAWEITKDGAVHFRAS
jgi:predicted lactoylglutathione lyase